MRGKVWVAAALAVASIAATAWAAAARTEYLRRKAKIRSDKRASASAVVELKRGTAVRVIRKSGAWRLVQVGAQQGWVHRSRLSRTQPKNLGADDSVAVADARATGIGASGALRGLSEEAERYAANKNVSPQARLWVEKMIGYRVEPAALDRFAQAGKVGEYSEGE